MFRESNRWIRDEPTRFIWGRFFVSSPFDGQRVICNRLELGLSSRVFDRNRFWNRLTSRRACLGRTWKISYWNVVECRGANSCGQVGGGGRGWLRVIWFESNNKKVKVVRAVRIYTGSRVRGPCTGGAKRQRSVELK